LLQGINTLSKIHIYSKIAKKNKKKSCTWKKKKVFVIKNYKKHCSKIHLYKKIIFGQKEMKSFSKITPLAHLTSFAPS
jgi:hypothetical protein